MHTTIEIQGTKVPAVGFGTWQVTGRACVEAVSDALELGYRHIDTARAYGNEREVGDGIRASGGASLRDLGVDDVDLLLLHWPAPSVPLQDTLEAMTALRDDGRVRHFGVSNFGPGLLREALELAPVFCDQVPFHPFEGQRELVDLAQRSDVLVTAYSPIARGRVARDATLREIGAAHGKTASQVALRWLLDHPKTCVIPKASTHERRAENLDVFDFSLSDEERARIDALG